MNPGPVPGGVLVVDKPAGMTSHDVVARVRRLAGTRRVGHAGTLDPAATGVLVLGIDWSTRLLAFMAGHDKSYEATIRLGAATVTDDAEGDVVTETEAADLDEVAVQDAVARLTGAIEQVPSAVSAIKVAGVRSYARVRDGQDVQLPARPVHVARFDLGPLRRHRAEGGRPGWTEVDVVLTVSAGTYVRALARDLGAALGVGGHLTRLRRTRSGPFAVDDAVTLDDLRRAGTVTGHVVPPAAAARRFMPSVHVDEAVAHAVRHGRRQPGQGTGAPVVAVLDDADALLAVADDSGTSLRLLAVVPLPGV